MDTFHGKLDFNKPIQENLKFELFKNYYYNKYKIVDEELIRKKMIEDNFCAEQHDENRKMPLKYYREYNLNEDLIKNIQSLGKILLKKNNLFQKKM